MEPLRALPCDEAPDELPERDHDDQADGLDPDDPCGDGHLYGPPETWNFWTDVFSFSIAEGRSDG